MTESEMETFLISCLLSEDESYAGIRIPETHEERWRLLRSLMNVRPPKPAGPEFLEVQDAYLQLETRKKGVVSLDETVRTAGGFRIWQGDITRLAADAVVNAANSGMTGCYAPCHGCIDNQIHTWAGIQLRLECAALTGGRMEPAGRAMLTGAWNLPARHVIHTVGPVIGRGGPTADDRKLLASCYRSVLECAQASGISSVAFCCISTGEFRYPQREAAVVAVSTVRDFVEEKGNGIEIVFNVFRDSDRRIYEGLLR